PISFQMNLYDALFIKRPVVEPELFASLRPPTYSGAIEKLADAMPEGKPAGAPMEQFKDKKAEKSKADESRDAEFRGGFGRSGATHAGDVLQSLNAPMNLGQSVASAASAS